MFCSDLDQEYYKKLYDIESYLRFIVYWELRSKDPSGWKGILEEELIKEIADRIEQEKSIGYIDHREFGFLCYLNLTELKDILLGALWEDCFKENWGSHDLIAADFKKLIAIRNKVAHFRAVSKKDVKVIDDFSYYLNEWTNSYRDICRYATLYSQPDELSSDIRLNEKYSKSVNRIIEISNSLGPGFIIHLKKYKKYISIILKVDDNTFDPEYTKDFFKKNNKAVAFIAVSKLGDRLAIYIPDTVSDEAVLKIVNASNELYSNTISLLSSEEIDNSYLDNGVEGIYLSSHELPFQFPNI